MDSSQLALINIFSAFIPILIHPANTGKFCICSLNSAVPCNERLGAQSCFVEKGTSSTKIGRVRLHMWTAIFSFKFLSIEAEIAYLNYILHKKFI